MRIISINLAIAFTPAMFLQATHHRPKQSKVKRTMVEATIVTFICTAVLRFIDSEVKGMGAETPDLETTKENFQ